MNSFINLISCFRVAKFGELLSIIVVIEVKMFRGKIKKKKKKKKKLIWMLALEHSGVVGEKSATLERSVNQKEIFLGGIIGETEP